MSKTIAITGATGFIGKYLVSELVRKGGYNIRVLSRDKQRDLLEGKFTSDVEIFEGDLGDPKSLNDFLVPGCTVINLVYLWNAGRDKNITCTRNLLEACRSAGVSRLIHCSTADVTGRVFQDMVNEQTQCHPVTEYGVTKLQIERSIISYSTGVFDTVVLRPTAVLGTGGQSLKKLVFDISTGNHWKNYLKSCMFGNRRMNLVPVANVVAAIIFLSRYVGRFNGEIFIISEDDDPENNFNAVEMYLRKALGAGEYRFPRFPVPLTVLKSILLLMGKSNVNPRCNYDSGKIRKLGFSSPVRLRDGLAEYLSGYPVSNPDKK